MKTRKFLIASIVVFIIVGFSACAPKGYTSNEAGFFSGIWHGLIFLFSLIGKLFGADIGLYAMNNSGFWYWLGFLFGMGGLGGGGYYAGNR